MCGATGNTPSSEPESATGAASASQHAGSSDSDASSDSAAVRSSPHGDRDSSARRGTACAQGVEAFRHFPGGGGGGVVEEEGCARSLIMRQMLHFCPIVSAGSRVTVAACKPAR